MLHCVRDALELQYSRWIILVLSALVLLVLLAAVSAPITVPGPTIAIETHTRSTLYTVCAAERHPRRVQKLTTFWRSLAPIIRDLSLMPPRPPKLQQTSEDRRTIARIQELHTRGHQAGSASTSKCVATRDVSDSLPAHTDLIAHEPPRIPERMAFRAQWTSVDLSPG